MVFPVVSPGGATGGGRLPFSPDGFAVVTGFTKEGCSSIGGKGVVVVKCSGLQLRFLVSASVHSSPLFMWLHNALYALKTFHLRSLLAQALPKSHKEQPKSSSEPRYGGSVSARAPLPPTEAW